MPPAHRTELAILGLLAAGPKSGYDIKKESEEKLSHFWSASYGHLYPVLESLRQRDLVERRREEQEGRPARYVYSLTEDGWEALREWFARPAEYAKPRNELLLRVFFGESTEPAALVREIERFRSQPAANLELLRHVMPGLGASLREGEPTWLLPVFFGEFWEPAALVREIERFRSQSAANLELLRHVMRELAASRGERERYWLLTADYGVRVMEALVAWCDDALRVLDA